MESCVSEKSDEVKNCAKCNIPLSEESNFDKIHTMMHMLIEQLNKMPVRYGRTAMMKLLCAHSPFPKEEFLQRISEAWDAINEFPS